MIIIQHIKREPFSFEDLPKKLPGEKHEYDVNQKIMDFENTHVQNATNFSRFATKNFHKI